MSLRRTVIVGVFGATTGLTLTEFGPDGARAVHHEEIPWEERDGGLYWPSEWLGSALDGVKERAKPEDVIALAMPGADLAISTSDGPQADPPSDALQHYRGVMDGGFIERALRSLPAEEIYRRTGGANVAAFQPYAQLLAQKERHPRLMEEARLIVPLSDWMTWRLSGHKGHDPVMLQDQGLTQEGGMVCEEAVDLPGLAERIAPWRVFGETEILPAEAGFYVCPVTHDSVPARMAGYSASPWVVWTGTWIGTACQVKEIHATEEALSAGIAFEGASESLSAITNVGMPGRIYKLLVQRAGIAFEAAAERATATLARRKPEVIDVGRLPAHEGEAVKALVARYGERDDDLLAGMIWSAASACAEKMTATARLLNMPAPDEVAVIGGWGLNRAFIGALREFYRDVTIPAQAAQATSAGLAAEALVKAGDAPNVREALAMLPEL